MNNLSKQDKLMDQIAREHNAQNPGHICKVYGNFINCTCGYHAHCADGHSDFLILHNADYTVNKQVSPGNIS
jgi:hypothetical protein